METNTRPLLELWLIVEENFDELFESGICNVIFKLRQKGIFTMQDEKVLIKIVDHYITDELNIFSVYGWPSGEKEPRKKFIHDQIMKELIK